MNHPRSTLRGEPAQAWERWRLNVLRRTPEIEATSVAICAGRAAAGRRRIGLAS
jgi:hypothetical protein